MFEHMKNYEKLFEKVSKWLKPESGRDPILLYTVYVSYIGRIGVQITGDPQTTASFKKCRSL